QGDALQVGLEGTEGIDGRPDDHRPAGGVHADVRAVAVDQAGADLDLRPRRGSCRGVGAAGSSTFTLNAAPRGVPFPWNFWAMISLLSLATADQATMKFPLLSRVTAASYL